MTEPQRPGGSTPPSATTESGYWGSPPPASPVPAPQPVAAPPTASQAASPAHSPAAFHWQPVDYTASPPPPVPVRSVVRPRVPVAGLLIVTTGLILAIVSVSSADWFSGGFFGTHFGSLHDIANLAGAPTFFSLYFSWLGITLLIVSFVVACAAKLFDSANVPLRVTVLLLSLAGASTTFAAPLDVGSFDVVMRTSDAGYWCMIAGFLLIGAGGVIRV